MTTRKGIYSNSDTAILNKAVKALKSQEINRDEPFVILNQKVSEIARKGAKKEFVWRHLTIRYFPEPGKFYFKVTNPITGVVRNYYTRDYVTTKGNNKWRKLSSDIKRT